MLWTITKDKINDVPLEVGTGNCKDKSGLDFTFRLLDGDNEIYFYGKSNDRTSQSAFNPLDTIGAGYGCTTIQYKVDGKWETL